MSIRLFALCLFLFLSALARAEPRFEYEPRTALKLAKRSADTVQVIEDRPLRRHVVLGRWWGVGDISTSPERLLEIARGQAADLGADFIWISKRDMTTHRTGGPASGSGASIGGTIIGFAPLLNASFGVFARASTGIRYQGPRVAGFTDGSAAPAAGVRVEDVVLEIDGVKLGSEQMPERILENLPGQVVKLLVNRAGTILTIEVPLISSD